MKRHTRLNNFFNCLTASMIIALILSGQLSFGQKTTTVQKFTEIDPAPFADNTGHWYSIRNKNNMINAMPGKPRYKPTEIINIADNLVLFQKINGGWPKNYDFFAILTDKQKDSVAKGKNVLNTTFDNGNTYTQIALLSIAYSATKIEKYKSAALKGLDFLLSAHYKNGG